MKLTPQQLGAIVSAVIIAAVAIAAALGVPIHIPTTYHP